ADATVLTVSSSAQPSAVGQSVTFTATVVDVNGGTPTGAVEFYDGAVDLGSGTPLSPGGGGATSTLAISTLSAGVHTITAVYTPTGIFLSSKGTLTQTVDAATSTAATSNHNPSSLGQSVTFTATVTNTSSSGGTPTGAVEFYDGSTDLGAGSSLSGSGNAAASTLTISTLAVGNHAIKAVYTPSGFFLGGSGTLTQTVGAVTSTGVVSSDDPAPVGQSITFTATITNTTNSSTPTGTVEFFDGLTGLGAGSALSGSGASVTSTFTTSTLAAGVHYIVAVYTPTGDFAGSSGTVRQVVTGPPAVAEFPGLGVWR
ncbi:MAG TPA: Ig-like domain-containing protein, partial [Gemmataceae bacterium]|nr:Ig-like domain-containing protein [Gemmataceae bacterium]